MNNALELALEDESVDELDDGLLVVGVEVLELAEALEKPLAVEGDVFGEVAGGALGGAPSEVPSVSLGGAALGGAIRF